MVGECSRGDTVSQTGHGRSPFCKEVAPVVCGEGLPIYCCLRAGHEGKHSGERGDSTCEWDADALDARRFSEPRRGRR